MSGGTFDYIDGRLKNEIFGYSDEFNNALEDVEISHLVWDVLELLHAYDWYKAGDTGKEDYKKAVKKFKTKWFNTMRSVRIREYIEDSIFKVRMECLDLIGAVSTTPDPVKKELIDRYGEYVDKATAANILHVTRQTVYAMIEDRRLQTGYRGKRISVASIADYMKSKGGSHGSVDQV